MKKFLFSLALAATMVSSPVSAAWTGYVEVVRTEIAAAGVYFVTPGITVTGTNCVAGQNYVYIHYSSAADSKLVDRVLSSVFYAQATNKKIKAFVQSCSGGVAVANSVWIE